MRTIHGYKANPANDMLEITVIDEPGPGGANHQYSIHASNGVHCRIGFQNGPIGEHGVNGVTNETLLAIVIDRLRAFQAGPFSCRENALALTKIEEAQHWLLHRTRERMARGVEGKTAA